MEARRILLCTVLIGGLLPACGGSKNEPEPKPCVETGRAYAMPSPLWGAGDAFAPPAGDRAVELLTDIRPTWAAQLDQVEGWPRLPTVIIPLSGQATSVDPTGVHWFGSDAGPLVELEMQHTAEVLNDGRSLVIKPTGPVPPEVGYVVVVIAPGAVTGAEAIAVCGPAGGPHPDYAAAEAALPEGTQAELALPFSLANSRSALGHLWRRLQTAPVLTVAELTATPLADLGAKAPPPEVAALLSPDAAIGILDLPDYRGADGTMVQDEDDAPAPAGRTRPGIAIGLPAAGSPPYPVVLFQHGGGQDKRDFFQLAGPLLEAGFAFVGIDLPYHGDRAAPSGGNDLDILDFDDLLATRDNFRQAVADHMAVLSGLAELNAAIEETLGVADALDPDRTFYMGLSMGALSGSLTFASAKDLNAAALFVGAGGFSEIVRYGMFSLFIDDILTAEPIETEVILGLAEVLLDGADPHAYAQVGEDRSSAPRPVLFFQAIDEAIISHPVSDAWAKAFGADLAVPFHHPVAGMDELGLPASGNFTWEGGAEAATRILFENPMAEQSPTERHGALITLPYTQQQVAHCFAGVLAGTGCEAIDTGYFDH